MEMREDALPGKEALMTTQDNVAFVRRGYDAYNADNGRGHQVPGFLPGGLLVVAAEFSLKLHPASQKRVVPSGSYWLP